MMDGAVVESGAMLAAASLLTPDKRVPAGQLWAGRPARYVELARSYRASTPESP